MLILKLELFFSTKFVQHTNDSCKSFSNIEELFYKFLLILFNYKSNSILIPYCKAHVAQCMFMSQYYKCLIDPNLTENHNVI